MVVNRAVATRAQQALLRARELCLVGDYDTGIQELRAVQRTLELQLGGDPEARAVTSQSRLFLFDDVVI